MAVLSEGSVSQIASFHALSADLFDDLVAAATPKVVTVEKRHLLFLKTATQQSVDDFWGKGGSGAFAPTRSPS